MEFKDKFIAFMDILGWKEMVNAAEAGTGMTINNLIDVLRDLGTAEARKTYGTMQKLKSELGLAPGSLFSGKAPSG